MTPIGLPSKRQTTRLDVIAILAIVSLSFVAFYLPQTANFWGGYDEFQAFSEVKSVAWSDAFDSINGRPLLGLSFALGKLTGGGSIEGHLWFAWIITTVNAILLWGLVRLMLPNASAMAFAAAALLVINRADPLKFYPLWAASPYSLAVGLTLAATILFVWSWRKQNRAMLIAGCCCLGASLLMYEVGYLVAMVPLIMLTMERQRSPLWRFWCYAWCATLGLFALRVVLFNLSGESSYQAQQFASSGSELNSFSDNFFLHLSQIKQYTSFSKDSMRAHPMVGLVVFSVVGGLTWHLSKQSGTATVRQVWGSVTLAAIGMVLGIALYSHMQGNERTQFFAAPAQAVLVVGAIAMVMSKLPATWNAIGFSLCVGLVTANGAVQSYRSQFSDHNVSYRSIVHVVEQLNVLTAGSDEDLVVMMLFEGSSPTGCSYHMTCTSKNLLQRRVYTLGEQQDGMISFEFRDTEMRSPANVVFNDDLVVPYRNVVFCHLESDGTVRLLREMPSRIVEQLDKAVIDRGYDPFAVLPAGEVMPHPEFDYPSWSGPPADVVRIRQGVVLGSGWTTRHFSAGSVYRDVENQAEIIINGQGKTTAIVDLDFGVLPGVIASGEIIASNDAGETIARWNSLERRVVELSVPCEPGKMQRLTFQATSTDGAIVPMRFYAVGTVYPEDTAMRTNAITRDGVRLGKNWYPFESYKGESFRWLNTDGEILLPYTILGATQTLRLDAAVGPGATDGSCQVDVVDDDGDVLATSVLSGRQTLRFPLTAKANGTQRLKLVVHGGGQPHGADPRLLNLRVFECGLTPSGQSSDQ